MELQDKRLINRSLLIYVYIMHVPRTGRRKEHQELEARKERSRDY